jgi:hypothetical protein
MGTDLTYSTAYHPQTDGQTERVIQILEDMLRANALISEKKWVTCLPFAEFSYNNSYQASIKMSPFEALYGKQCRTPINWSESRERPFFGPDLVKDAEDQVKIICENLRIAQSRQKTYADRRRRELHFKVGDHVYLKVSPLKGTRRFQVKGKLAPHFVGPFQITKRVGVVAYQLDLPQSLSAVHNVFHISQLKKCLYVPTDLVNLETLDLQAGLTYEEHPIAILDYDERKVKRSMVKFVKVQWTTTPRMKPHANARIVYAKTTLISSSLGKPSSSPYHTPLPS